jgi:uncharacterized protein YyaL (SSP411 family)
MPNKLLQEKSPYLLQHAYNPVDWYPWGPEAFSRAKGEDKPIFLSIGYSTCHWCHVMEKESFEDEEVAQILNREFISVKVDREERPDIDHIYMEVCMMVNGHGGWPLTLILTPDRKPFHAGTYYPKTVRMGMPGLVTLLNNASNAWKNKRDDLLSIADQLESLLNKNKHKEEPAKQGEEKQVLSKHLSSGILAGGRSPDGEVFRKAFTLYDKSFDRKYGGFGSAPKFPAPHNLLFLLRYWHATRNADALDIVEKTLESMYRGGIYDHIGYGFCRYSTDRKWLVPHFEKMLYDNALLAITYLEVHQATGKAFYADVASQILDYVLRDMTAPECGFYSAEDADSEGEEGKFYVWIPEEVAPVLGGKDGARFCQLFDITEDGNFEGLNIPNLINSPELTEDDRTFAESSRQKLFEIREKRVHPFKDDKILTSWNGLMIAAMAMGGRVLGNGKYTVAAENAADFILTRMVDHTGRLLARYRDGDASIKGFSDDYSFLIFGLIELFETNYRPQYLEKALSLNQDMLRLFWDEAEGGLYFYGSDSEQLLSRPKEAYDGAMPSANSIAAMNLLRLARICMDPALEEKAFQIFDAFGSSIENTPTSHSMMLSAFLHANTRSRELIIISDKSRDEMLDDQLLSASKKHYDPFMISICIPKGTSEGYENVIPAAANYKSMGEASTAYLCENYTCTYPVTDTESLTDLLKN